MDKQQSQTVVAYDGPAIIRRLLNTVPDELLQLLAEIEAEEAKASQPTEQKAK